MKTESLSLTLSFVGPSMQKPDAGDWDLTREQGLRIRDHGKITATSQAA